MRRRKLLIARRTALIALLVALGCGGGGSGDGVTSAPLAPVELPVLEIAGQPVRTGFDAESAAAISLDGAWRFLEDPNDAGRDDGWMAPGHDRSGWRDIPVPGTWNLAFGGELFRYTGAGWYARSFEAPTAERVRLRFGAVFLLAEVWVNGVAVGAHSGGYTPFEVDVTDALVPGENLLVVRADNRLTRTTIPCLTIANPEGHGWYPYGGITRSVALVADGGVAPFKLDLRARPTDPEAAAAARGPEALGELPWRVSAAVGLHNATDASAAGELTIEIADADGTPVARLGPRRVDLAPGAIASFGGEVTLERVRVWDRDRPANRYVARARFGETWAEDSFGMRTVAVRDGEILLNGRAQMLRGISRHEDHPELGPVTTPELAERDVALLLELGANHIRPGHYAANPIFLDALARAGITVTEEVPVYQLDLAQLGNADMLADATRQLLEMVERDLNEPAILMWSLENESWRFLEVAGDFIRALKQELLRFDDTRLLTSSAVTIPVLSAAADFVAPEMDVLSINEYWGWYYGRVGQLGAYLDRYHERFPELPMVLSEFGAGAVAAPNYPWAGGDEPVGDHSYSHAYQRWYLERHIAQALERPYVAGVMPWAFADFRMEWEQATGKPHPAELTNLKGLVDQQRRRKPAFDAVGDLYRRIADNGTSPGR